MEKTNHKSSLILGGKSRTIIQSFSTPTRGGPSVFHRALRKLKFRDVAAEIDLSQTISPFLAKFFSFIVCFIFSPPEAGRRSQNTGTSLERWKQITEIVKRLTKRKVFSFLKYFFSY
jgi:hypothetical protein